LPLINIHESTILFLSPSITPALTPPAHGAESVVTGALQHYISTLRRELGPQNANVVELKLGHFDFGSSTESRQQIVLAPRAEATKKRLELLGLEKTMVQGSPLRSLHNGVFDAIVRGKGKNGIVFVGQGSRMYDLVRKLVPTGVVGWMMGGTKAQTPILRRSKSDEVSSGSAEWEKVEQTS